MAQQGDTACDGTAGHSHRSHLEPQRATVAVPPQLPGMSSSYELQNRQATIAKTWIKTHCMAQYAVAGHNLLAAAGCCTTVILLRLKALLLQFIV